MGDPFQQADAQWIAKEKEKERRRKKKYDANDLLEDEEAPVASNNNNASGSVSSNSASTNGGETSSSSSSSSKKGTLSKGATATRKFVAKFFGFGFTDDPSSQPYTEKPSNRETTGTVTESSSHQRGRLRDSLFMPTNNNDMNNNNINNNNMHPGMQMGPPMNNYDINPHASMLYSEPPPYMPGMPQTVPDFDIFQRVYHDPITFEQLPDTVPGLPPPLVPYITLTSNYYLFPSIQIELIPNIVYVIGRYSKKPLIDALEDTRKRIEYNCNVVSREHCEIFAANGKVLIRDVGSSSGTYLNGVRLSSSMYRSPTYFVQTGDLLDFGTDYHVGQIDHVSRVMTTVAIEYKEISGNPPNNLLAMLPGS